MLVQPVFIFMPLEVRRNKTFGDEAVGGLVIDREISEKKHSLTMSLDSSLFQSYGGQTRTHRQTAQKHRNLLTESF